MSPKVNESHLEARRQQILLAAYRCFGEKGFHQTTMKDICAEADLSPGAVYSYFSGKDDILQSVAACGRENTRNLIDSMATPEDGPGALRAILGNLIRFLMRPEVIETSRFDVRLWGEALHTPSIHELMESALESVSEPFADVANRGQARGEIDRQLNPRAVARVLVALVLGLQVQAAVDPDMEFEDCAEVVEALVAGSFVRAGKEGKA